MTGCSAEGGLRFPFCGGNANLQPNMVDLADRFPVVTGFLGSYDTNEKDD